MNKIKLNIACGSRPLSGYINLDMDSLSKLKKRYPNKKFSKNIVLKNWNVFKLPLKDNSVSIINSDAFIEHLSFLEEPKFFKEMVRVIKPGGKIKLSTVDFEKTVKDWLKAEDKWLDFYRDDKQAIKDQHWFGTYTYDYKNRWGYIAATLFGSQNGAGQYHKNCYTKKKLRSMCNFLNLKVLSIEGFRWHGNKDHMIKIIAEKKR
jgi:ubiquinone/menaquinone biosynthesis C-methylase UbiE